MTVTNLSEETISAVQDLVDFHSKVTQYVIRVAWVLERSEGWNDQLDVLDYLHKGLDSLSSSLDQPASRVSLWLSSGNDSELGKGIGAAVLALEDGAGPVSSVASHLATSDLGGEAAPARGWDSGDRDSLDLPPADQAGESIRGAAVVAVPGAQGCRPVGVVG